MTKKDYDKAASIARGIEHTGHRALVCSGFIALFQGDNPRFDVDRFVKACGIMPVQAAIATLTGRAA